MPLPAGTRLGPYEILSAIGAGGMGEVYLARDPRLGRDVAIKVLPAEVAADPDRLRRFEQEARVVGRLNHPHIVAIHDVGVVPDGLPAAGAPFLVTELLEGRTLRDEMIGHALSWRTALMYAREIADGLAAAHDKGVVHRDVKPENVFVTRGGHIKILDFGLAKLRPDTDVAAAETAMAAGATGPGVVMGTTTYMSPEQVRGQDTDHRSDIFSFGSVLYEMLTGRRVFHGATGAETMGAILHVDPPAMSIDAASGPSFAAVERIVRRCLEKSPERRFQSARDLAFAFEGLTDGRTSPVAIAAPPAPARTTSWRAVLIVAGLGALGVAGWSVWPRGAAPVRAPESAPLASVTPFLTGSGVVAVPAWSPAANLIAYASDAAGNEDVWMTDLTGANPINLTKDHAGADTFPAWAPDGQHIAFYSDRDGGGVYTMTPLGANIRRVAAVRPSVVYTFSLQWANDGSIVYTNFDERGDKHVYRVSANGATPACLTCGQALAEGARAGALSPSGRLVAYVGGLIGPRPGLYVLNLSSGRAVELADRADAPHWRDDRHLMFVSARDGLPDLWEVAVDPESGVKDREPVRITSGLNVTAFATSKDGRQILAVKERTSSAIVSFPTAARQIDSLSQGTALTAGEFRDQRPRWSADGRDVFFESNRRGSVNVWRVPVAGGQPVRLSTGVGLEQRPRPSPDGRWVAYDKDGNFTWVMRPDGSGAHAAANWEEAYTNACCSAWSPDSRRAIVSGTLKSGGGRLAFADVDPDTGTFKLVRVQDMPGSLEEYVRWSPDGRAIAYEAFSEGSFDIWVADADGKSPRRLTSFPGNERSSSWQAAPLQLYFRDERTIWRMPMTDALTPAGPPVRWLAIPGLRAMGDSLDISPDSKHIVVALARPESDIWLVERK